MKKLLNILILLFSLFISINIVYADGDTTGVADGTDDTTPTQGQVEKQKQAIDAYCSENAKIDGCVYDKNNSIYTKFKGGRYSVYNSTYAPRVDPITGTVYNQNYIAGVLEIPSNLELKRGYQAFDGNGKGVYAACYRYDLSQADFDKLESPGGGPGSYFIFTFIVEDSKKGCQVKRTEIIPAQGVSGYYYYTQFFKLKTAQFSYNGQNSLFQKSAITLNGWRAQNGGACPKVFGYTANTKWYTKDSNKYIFSENTSDFNIETYAFWSGEKYTLRPGCTVEDQDGKAKAQELLAQIKDEIDNYSCPSKLEDMADFAEELEDYYLKLRENNEYRVLWSAGLIDEVTRQSAQKEIDGYIKAKLNSCQYNSCGISTAEQNKINQNKGNACKNGCTLSNVTAPSNDPNAKCYCCGGSQGCTYKWMIPQSGNTCSLQKDMTIGQCIGTTKDLECRNCLVKAYEDAGLDESKIACLINTEILKAQVEQNLIEENKNAADEDVKQEIEENRNIREEIFANLIKKPDIEIYGGSMSCETLLGPGLTKVLNFAIDAIRIIGVIGTIVIAMIKLIPPVSKGDQSELQKAAKSCIWSAIVLIIIVMLPTLIKVIGKLFGFDTSCIL